MNYNYRFDNRKDIKNQIIINFYSLFRKAIYLSTFMNIH